MLDRILIILKWAVFSGCLFFALSLFMPYVIASMASAVISTGAFFHPDNELEVFKLKRPQIILKG